MAELFVVFGLNLKLQYNDYAKIGILIYGLIIKTI